MIKKKEIGKIYILCDSNLFYSIKINFSYHKHLKAEYIHIDSANQLDDSLAKDNTIVVIANPFDVTLEQYRKIINSNSPLYIYFEHTFINIENEKALHEFLNNSKTNIQFEDNSNIYYRFFKRCFDILISFFGVIIILPLLTLILKIIYVFHGDKSNLIYAQNRVGKNGKTYKLYKYRTMVNDADLKLEILLSNLAYKDEWERKQKIQNDPRITKIGNKVRKYSIDEMPQLINVLKGDMSLIGPRPLVSGELESHEGLDLYRLIKPGIAGWWVCNGKSDLNYYERLELEYFYIKNYSLRLDATCIYRTIFIVFKNEGE